MSYLPGYRGRFVWQPTLVAHDPTFVLSIDSQSIVQITASDSAVFSDLSPVLIQVVSFDVMESVLQSDLSAVDAALIGADGGILAETSSPTVILAVLETGSLSDTSSLSQLFVVSDAASLTDLASPSQLQLLSVVDAWGLLEASQIALSASVIDAFSQNDASSLATAMATADQFLGLDASSIQAALAATDAVTQIDAAQASEFLVHNVVDSLVLSDVSLLVGQAAISVTDLAGFSESVSNAAAVAATDASLHDEASATTATLSTLESFVLSELAISSQLLTLSVSDALSLAAEVTSLALNLSVNDAHTQVEASPSIALSVNDQTGFAEALSLLASMTAFDASVLSSELSQGGETLGLNLSDILIQSEASVLTATSLKAVADSITTLDVSDAQALLNAADGAQLAEVLALLSTVSSEDASTAAEVLNIAALIASSDQFEIYDLAVLDSEALIRVIGALVTAAATITSMVTANIVNISQVDAFTPSASTTTAEPSETGDVAAESIAVGEAKGAI